MNERIARLIEDSDMNLREDGVAYDTLGLIKARRDVLNREIEEAEKSGSNYICLKVPSGSERSIHIDIARHVRGY